MPATKQRGGQSTIPYHSLTSQRQYDVGIDEMEGMKGGKASEIDFSDYEAFEDEVFEEELLKKNRYKL